MRDERTIKEQLKELEEFKKSPDYDPSDNEFIQTQINTLAWVLGISPEIKLPGETTTALTTQDKIIRPVGFWPNGDPAFSTEKDKKKAEVDYHIVGDGQPVPFPIETPQNTIDVDITRTEKEDDDNKDSNEVNWNQINKCPIFDELGTMECYSCVTLSHCFPGSSLENYEMNHSLRGQQYYDFC